MQIDIKIDPGFKGPSLSELEPVIFDIEGRIEIPWNNSKNDQVLLERLYDSDLHMVLIVRDYEMHMKASTTLGLWVSLDEEMVKNTKETLVKKSSTGWRPLVEAIGPVKATTVLSHIVGSSIRSGKKPKTMVSVLSSCLHQGVGPIDVDVLLRLRNLRSGE